MVQNNILNFMGRIPILMAMPILLQNGRGALPNTGRSAFESNGALADLTTPSRCLSIQIV